MFRKEGRQLIRLQRQNLLEFGGSDSHNSESDSDPAVQEKYLHNLIGWSAKSPVEKKLVLGIMHREGHKNFEETLADPLNPLTIQARQSILEKRKNSIISNLTNNPLIQPKKLPT